MAVTPRATASVTVTLVLPTNRVSPLLRACLTLLAKFRLVILPDTVAARVPINTCLLAAPLSTVANLIALRGTWFQVSVIPAGVFSRVTVQLSLVVPSAMVILALSISGSAERARKLMLPVSPARVY